MNIIKTSFLLLPALAVLFSSCNEQKGNSSSEKGLPYIVDLEQCMETERAMKISDIADTVEYIELKTPKDLPITRVWDIIPVDDYWIIHTRDGVYKFTNKGEYIKTIGRRGKVRENIEQSLILMWTLLKRRLL